MESRHGRELGVRGAPPLTPARRTRGSASGRWSACAAGTRGTVCCVCERMRARVCERVSEREGGKEGEQERGREGAREGAREGERE